VRVVLSPSTGLATHGLGGEGAFAWGAPQETTWQHEPASASTVLPAELFSAVVS